MKINKLFHWLYAILMLLPIFAIGVTCAYVTFNKNAFESYYGDTINEKQYETDFVSNLKVGQNYSFIFSNVPTQSQSSNATDFALDKLTIINNNLSTYYENVTLRIYVTSSNLSLYYQLLNYTPSTSGTITNQVFEFTFNRIVTNSNSTNNILNNYLYKIEYNKYSFLDNVFYYSLDEMKNNPLFSWANNNFLTNPFSYLFNLFGVPINSGIMTLLSYWLDISIIWLVFDLIMYVPLLAHRWIDKGMID